MQTQITSKIASFTLAVVLNGLMLAGIGYVFDAEAQPQSSVIASSSHAVQSSGEAA
jgi:Na+/melibiose symporter-like transporter